MKMNNFLSKKMAAGTLALMLGLVSAPHLAFADEAKVVTPTATITLSNTAASTGKAMIVSTKAVDLTKVSFVSFMADMKVSSKAPKATLDQAEKLFNSYKKEISAGNSKAAMAQMESMMKLLQKYMPKVEAISATLTSTSSAAAVCTEAVKIEPAQSAK